jgi:hypothetical protein
MGLSIDIADILQRTTWQLLVFENDASRDSSVLICASHLPIAERRADLVKGLIRSHHDSMSFREGLTSAGGPHRHKSDQARGFWLYVVGLCREAQYFSGDPPCLEWIVPAC